MKQTGFGYRSGGRKGLAGRMNKTAKPVKSKKIKLPNFKLK